MTTHAWKRYRMMVPARPGRPGFRLTALVVAVLCAWSVAVARQEPPEGDYQLQVADPPQLLGGKYHVVQLLKVRAGKVSLECVVTPTKQGAELKVRARILVTGVDRVKRVRVLVDRRSTGVIESEFIHKLEARLGLDHL